MIRTTTRTSKLAIVSIGLAAGLLGAGRASAQTCGDVNGDDKVTAADSLLVLKASVGQDVALTCTDQCAALAAQVAALDTRTAALETLLAHVTISGSNLVLTGMNFQVVSGSGTSDGSINGKGNIIIGYDESNSNKEKKTGSHNLVIGKNHSYEAFEGIVAGEDNIISGDVASVLGGTQNTASGNGAIVVGGQNNEARQTTSIVVAGEQNLANGRSCVVTAGAQNLCTGLAGAVDGGSQNFCSGAGSVIGGGSNRTLGSSLGWLAGSLGPVF
ncbi:MAG TPA: hypothetical protein VGK20_09395 [Candidatus Binatia bacterium]